MSEAQNIHEADDRRVTTLELFFDLVFVFAITQLTALLADDPTPRGVLHVLLIFAVLWWMFGGYVWLTNAVTPDQPIRKILLLAAMVAFLVAALAIPTTFDGGGLVFGVAYLVVILIHAGLFTVSQRRAGLTGMLRVAPMNIVGALALVVAGVIDRPAAYLLWGVALGLDVITTLRTNAAGFVIAASHFVERHGLLMIIVLGESIVAIGVGAADLPLDISLVTSAGLALLIVSCLWWLYFNEDDARAEAALANAPADRRVRMALNAFYYAQIPMLLGVVSFAAGVKSAIAHAFEPMEPYAASFLAVGVSLYLLGDALLRLSIGWGHAGPRFAAAFVALATIPIGLGVSPVAQMAAVLVLLVVTILGRTPFRPTMPASDG